MEENLKNIQFMDDIEKIYNKLFGFTTGGSFMYEESPGLKLANRLYEEKYPDKYSEARKIEKKISSLQDELETILNYDEDEEEC